MRVPTNNPFKRLLRSYNLNQEEFAILIGKQRRTAQRICNDWENKVTYTHIKAIAKFTGKDRIEVFADLNTMQATVTGE